LIEKEESKEKQEADTVEEGVGDDLPDFARQESVRGKRDKRKGK